MKNQNILIAGIGGQGVVLAGKIISSAALKNGFDVKTSEVHGMSQRGGSVSTHIRFGKKIYSPLIPENCATMLLSFDVYETLRYIPRYGNKNTVIVSSSKGKFPPRIGTARKNEPPVNADPEEIIFTIKKLYEKAFFIDAGLIAKNTGNPRVSNIVLTGFLSNFTSIKQEVWLRTIDETLPEKLREINVKAFITGKDEYK